MFDLKFSYNWNHKLNCTAFTTLRLYNSAKHKKGEKVNLFLKDTSIGTGTIQSVNIFLLSELTEFVAYIDTGYSLKQCQEIIHRMYQHVDFTITRMALLLIVKDKKQEKEPEQKDLFNSDIQHS